jgi:hypothetical protein
MVAFLNSPLAIVLACIVGMLPAGVVWGVMAWLFRRDQRRWEVREQLRDMEQAIATGKPWQGTVKTATLELVRDDWPTGKGYTLDFLVRPNQ